MAGNLGHRSGESVYMIYDSMHKVNLQPILSHQPLRPKDHEEYEEHTIDDLAHLSSDVIWETDEAEYLRKEYETHSANDGSLV